MWRELSAMKADNEACAPTWFTGPPSTTAKAIRDRRDLIAEVERLRAALESLWPALALDLRYAGPDDDMDALRSRVDTVLEALAQHPGQQPDSYARDEGAK